MDNELIIKKLKKQIQSLGQLQFKDGTDSKFINRANKTKLYILNLKLEKSDEYLRKELISMLETHVKKMPRFKVYEEKKETINKINKAKIELQDLLRLFIETLELRENKSSNDNRNQIKINIDNTQFSIQKINIKQIIKNVESIIEKENRTEVEQEAAKEKLKEIEKELEKKSKGKNREKIKSILKRFADFGKETFIAILPAILKYYGFQD